jgi:hypothetical protein
MTLTKIFKRFRERRYFYSAIAYHTLFQSRSIDGIVKDSDGLLSQERGTELMSEYVTRGLVEKKPGQSNFFIFIHNKK